ncbi:hypothetical protein LZ198_10545 [Myxococcus sp. K15C18031901]|uniref:hypothetical protein n=1 Tax=Myxococcus dinghuensis TaxID=2906761 RepID=UPI0020A7F88C|nr:hypothetical protein [Myxococcus dinghuensis]MCP3099310.1 hypothetical protein [Myxococcus dinghuensis]
MRTFTRWMGMGLVAAALMVAGCKDRSRESMGQHNNQGATGGSGSSSGSSGSQEGTGGSGSMQGSDTMQGGDAGTAH